jgi:DNA-directed RNA polymerase subunit RPC12/RpoP
MGRVRENLQTFYICGQCKTKQFYLISDSPDIPCPDCGWNHGAKKKKDIPSKIKLSLGEYYH